MKERKKKMEDPLLMIEPLAQSVVENLDETMVNHSENPILQLQLTMATSSINHEYARMEFDETKDNDRQEQLLEYMADCRDKYFEARESLLNYDPNAVHDFEADLLRQKRETLHRFNA